MPTCARTGMTQACARAHTHSVDDMTETHERPKGQAGKASPRWVGGSWGTELAAAHKLAVYEVFEGRRNRASVTRTPLRKHMPTQRRDPKEEGKTKFGWVLFFLLATVTALMLLAPPHMATITSVIENLLQYDDGSWSGRGNEFGFGCKSSHDCVDVVTHVSPAEYSASPLVVQIWLTVAVAGVVMVLSIFSAVFTYHHHAQYAADNVGINARRAGGRSRGMKHSMPRKTNLSGRRMGRLPLQLAVLSVSAALPSPTLSETASPSRKSTCAIVESAPAVENSASPSPYRQAVSAAPTSSLTSTCAMALLVATAATPYQ